MYENSRVLLVRLVLLRHVHGRAGAEDGDGHDGQERAVRRPIHATDVRRTPATRRTPVPSRDGRARHVRRWPGRADRRVGRVLPVRL